MIKEKQMNIVGKYKIDGKTVVNAVSAYPLGEFLDIKETVNDWLKHTLYNVFATEESKIFKEHIDYVIIPKKAVALTVGAARRLIHMTTSNKCKDILDYLNTLEPEPVEEIPEPVKQTTALTVINSREILGKTVNVYGTFEEPLFMGKEVAEWIDYAKTGKGVFDVSSMLRKVDLEEKLLRKVFLSGQNRDMTFLTEDGLYEVLFKSTKPIAKKFKKQVKAILKEIRLTGSFNESVPQNPYKNLDKLAWMKIATTSEETNIKLIAKAKVSAEKIAKLKPKALLAEEFHNAEGTFTTEQVAAEFNILASDLNQILNKIGLIIPVNAKKGWRLYKDYMNRGFCTYGSQLYKEGENDENMAVKRPMLWTIIGYEFLYLLLKPEIQNKVLICSINDLKKKIKTIK